MKSLKLSWLLVAAVTLATGAFAQRQMETLGRGVVAIRQNSTQVYVGWRMLGTDPDDTKFNLYRVTGGVTNLLAANVTNSCNFVDNSANANSAHSWFVQPILNGVTQAISAAFSMPANAPTQAYLNIPLTPPPDGVAWDGVPYTYNANDCSVGDVDGDGEYEIILKWDPSNSHDNSQSGFTGDTYLDCYKLDGTRLWRIALGPNMRSGAHYMDFMVFDYDGDGKAELMCRTAPGAKDALGNYVGSVAKWQNANGARPAFNNTDDYRFNNPNANTTNGYVIHGPEFLSVFNGLTGEEMATATYYPKRDQDNNNDNPDTNRLDAVWGDHYGNRLDRFLAGVAYCDGLRPSAIFCRGYYTRAYLAAWDWRNGQLTKRWVFDSNDGTPGNTAYRGQGAHSLTIGDVDGDGKDEITYGACVIDDNGKGLYSTGLGHGDALHMSDMDPNRPGIEVWMVHESPSSYGPNGLEFRDAKSGSLIFGVDGQNADVGRGVAIDLDPRYLGYEMWGSRGGLMNAGGTQVWSSHPSSMNFACWWDDDLLREILDGTTISKWNWLNNTASSILSPGGIASNNSTKSTPNLSGDILGDWREEVIWRTSDNLNLRIYTTTTVTTNRFYTLMHDPQYRVAIAWQNTGYNQPPHPGFYIGPGMYPPPLAPDSDAQLAWRGGSGGNAWDVATTSNWSVNGIWTNTVITNFSAGSSVLFDLRASNNNSINLAAALSPSKVTVFSPSNFTFTGNGALTGPMKLFKVGPGKLTLGNTNDFTGATMVSGGALFVNGALNASAVTVERRGTPEGPSQFGGSGQLGNGLTVQAGCTLTVGAGTNSPGVLTVTNGVTLLGGVLNQFDLSTDATGLTNANDRVNISGNLVLKGTNTIEIKQFAGNLGGGVYPLFTYSGTLTGGLTNLTLSGTFIQPVSLTNPPGMIGLFAVVPAAPPNAPTNLVAGAVTAFQINLVWTDNSTNEAAFLIERSLNGINFSQIASVAGGTTLYSDTGLTADTTYYYRIRGTNLAGASGYSPIAFTTTTAAPPNLTWRGDGVSNVWDIATTADWWNETNLTFYGDGAFVTFNDSGSNSPTIALIGTISPGSVTVNSTKNYTLGGTGVLAGTNGIVKAGSGTFTLSGNNTFSGGATVNAGTLQLGAATAAGTGGITNNGGGTLRINGALTVDNPMDQNGSVTLDLASAGGNTAVRGAWTGNGTVTIINQQSSSRTFTIGGGGSGGGHMWNFSGTVDFGVNAGAFRINNDNTTYNFGSSNATFNVGTGTGGLNQRNGGTTTHLGALLGGPNTRLSGRGGTGSAGTTTYSIGGKNLSTTFEGEINNGGGTTTIIKVGAGVFTMAGNNIYSGTTTVSAGTLLMTGNSASATGAVTVASSGKLGGTGIVGGNTTVNGTLAPGVSGLGTLGFNGDLSFNSGAIALFEISKNPFANDQVNVGGTVNYAGTLDVVNTSLELFTAGDNFQLFNAAIYSGSFAAMNLPVLDDGLAWSSSQLTTDGRLWVVSTIPPVISHVGNSGNDLTFSGTGGTPNWTYFVLTATNAALPVAQWTRTVTNQFDAGGNFSFNAPLDAAAPQQFYRLLAQ